MGQLKTLTGTVEQLGGAWKGDAHRAFEQLMVRWNQDANNLQNALSDIADQLDKSGVTYTTTDTEQQDQMNSIANALG